MTNFSLAAMPESSKAKPRVDSHTLGAMTARAVFEYCGPARWDLLVLTFDELSEILHQTIEAIRNE